jgi:hypothetical protein
VPDWLPPQAPGGRPPPRFEPSPPRQPEVPQTPPAVPALSDRPAFVKAGGETNGLAVTSLVLGIGGLGVLVATAGVFSPVTIPCSIAAWICGAQARRRVDAGEQTTGRAQAQAGYVLGILGVVLGILALIAWVALLASGFDVDEFRRDLERQSNPDAREAMIGALATVLSR